MVTIIAIVEVKEGKMEEAKEVFKRNGSTSKSV